MTTAESKQRTLDQLRLSVCEAAEKWYEPLADLGPCTIPGCQDREHVLEAAVRALREAKK